MPAIPVKAVHSAAGASLSGNGPNVTASTKNASRHTTLAVRRTCWAGRAAHSQRGADQAQRRSRSRTRATPASLATRPRVPDKTVAASVTKLPVTWAVNSPCNPRNPAISTKPPLKLSKAEIAEDFLIMSLPHSPDARGNIQVLAGRRLAAMPGGPLARGHLYRRHCPGRRRPCRAAPSTDSSKCRGQGTIDALLVTDPCSAKSTYADNPGAL